MTKKITSEVDLFESIIQQNVIENEFNCKYAALATIQLNMAIEFTVNSVKELSVDHNKSRLHGFAKITKADRTNIDTNKRLKST